MSEEEKTLKYLSAMRVIDFNKMGFVYGKETITEVLNLLEKKDKIINNAITEIETLRTYFSEDLQPDFIRILEILKDKKVIDC